MAIYALGDATPELPAAGHFWVAPSATLIGRVRMRENASVWYGVTVRGDNEWITIGENSNVQDGAVLHADPGIPLTLGRGVTVGHMAMLHGCEIGDDTVVGVGSIILNHVKIGKNCYIGSNTLIPENKVIEDNSVVIGVPGKVVRPVDDSTTALIKYSADYYVENWKRHARDLRPL